jgi:hypothetical protein
MVEAGMDVAPQVIQPLVHVAQTLVQPLVRGLVQGDDELQKGLQRYGDGRRWRAAD